MAQLLYLVILGFLRMTCSFNLIDTILKTRKFNGTIRRIYIVFAFLLSSFLITYFKTTVPVIIFNACIIIGMILIYDAKLYLKLKVFTILMLINIFVIWIAYYTIDINNNVYVLKIFANSIAAMLIYAINAVNFKISLIKFKDFKFYLSVIAISTIPLLSSSAITLTILTFRNEEFVMFSSTLILLMNFIIFYLYKENSHQLAINTYQKFLINKKDSNSNQLLLDAQAAKNVNIAMHDIKNHYYAIRTLVENGKRNDVLNYINELQNFVESPQEFVNSSNFEINSILNYKLAQIKKTGADITVNVNIPEDMRISNFDLTAILGNLLDNAHDALKNTKIKIFSLDMKYEKGMLFLKISNSFTKKPITSGDVFLTTKKGDGLHGIGLISVKKAIEKYDGDIIIDFDKHTFTVDLMMYDKAI